MKILITGGAGFIGSHITDALINQGLEVVVVDNLVSGKKENLNPAAKFFELDIKDAEALRKVFAAEQPTAVCHMAAQKSVTASVKDPLNDAKENIVGSLTLFEICRELNIKKIAFASTSALYGDTDKVPITEDQAIEPASPYAIAKYAIEHYLRFYQTIYGFTPAILRLANVYGPRQDPSGEAGVIAIFCQKALSNQPPVVYGDGLQTRDYVYVEDVAEAFLRALTIGKSLTVNIGLEREVTVLDLINGLGKLSGKNLQPTFEPARAGELRKSSLASAQAQKLLGWQPNHDLDSGLGKTFQWFATNK